ncbi:MAG: GH92 family glycosyl hydrolase, partial [Bacteroidia bacterium]
MTSRTINYVFLFCFAFCFKTGIAQKNYAEIVNPFIGTGGHGHTFPGAVLPFGMVQLSPDTRIDGSWDGCGGYHYSDSIIYGFSHTHLSGTGVSDGGDILLAPMMGEPSIDHKIYSSKFSHLKEKASAGFYEVMLDDDHIKAELTATLRTGIHRYTFPKTSKANIILDLLHRDKTLACNVKVVDSVTVHCFRVSEAWAREQQVYAVIKFSKAFKKMEYVHNKKFKPALDEKLRETAQGACFQFDVSDEKPLIVKVAISAVGTEGAVQNMTLEALDWDFEKYKSNAEAAWNKELSKIEIKSDDKDKTTVFYTALYHCMIHPSLYMDVDGKYRGMDNKVHVATNFTYYSVFSLWDTFRGLHPLLTLIDRKRTNDFINTFLYQYADRKRLPVWELYGNETDCMIGYHAVSVIADAFMKGITNYDTAVAFDAMKVSANANVYGIPAYVKNGYLQVDDEPESVSKTLEYAYDDWCIATLAQKLGKFDDYNYYSRRAQSYKNLFDASTGFMRPRKNGNWLSPFDPREVNNHFTEANSWQYSFFVPHDLDGLMALHGGPAKFEQKLDELFSAPEKTTGRDQSDITGLIGQYAQGNEPSHHMAYLYNYVGKPQKTIDKVRQILNDFYKNTPDGLIGNEDCGQMSAWYVLSSLGIYPVCPGNPEYELASPAFDNIKINFENSTPLQINKVSEGSGNYIKSVSVGNSPNNRSAVPYQRLLTAGQMTFFMSDRQDSASKYGAALNFRPHTRVNTHAILCAPVIKSDSRSFKKKQQIGLEAINAKEAVKLVYTTDGSEPTQRSTPYGSPFFIDTSCVIKAKAYFDKDSSTSTTARFYKMPNNWHISIKPTYNKQYTAGGDEGLIDGIYGDVKWRKGDWQGYQGQNFECVIDLGQLQTVHSVSSDYLQDTRAWIVLPEDVEYFISKDGRKFTPLTK